MSVIYLRIDENEKRNLVLEAIDTPKPKGKGFSEVNLSNAGDN
jgi:hypothetical protein